MTYTEWSYAKEHEATHELAEEIQTEQNIKMSPTGDSQLYCGIQTPRGAAPFYMYENLSWIHDIHYIWGLPFCTPVTGTEFSMIRAPPHPPAAHCFPWLSLIPDFIHFSSTCPLFVALFHPAPALWSLTISSFHKSNFTSLHPPRPSITFPAPPLCPGVRASQDCVTTNVGTCWASLRSTLICLLRFRIDFL